MVKKIKRLIKTLNDACKAYYQEDRDIISDFEYDKLYNELEKLEEETGIVFSDSPTLNVGHSIVSNLKKAKHTRKMLSLDKTKEINKVEDFLGEEKAVISLKLDGITLALEYKEGEFKRAITRGNGETGEDVTHNAYVFKNIPLKIPYKGELIVRGEAVISFKEFEKINEKLENEEKYKNPRNLCSGTVRQLSNKIAKERNVSYIAFSLIRNDGNEDLKSDQLTFLRKLGFDVVEHKIVDRKNVSDTIKYFEKRVPFNEFATDGLVITFDSIEYSKSLGETAKFPKDSLAFKWADDIVNTTLLNVEWNTSRTGLINPVAIFEPAELEGTTVNRASLHNISIIKNLKLGIGDTISVYKANMIIPQVYQNFTQTDNLEIPKNCPVCNALTEIITIKDATSLKCTNNMCLAKLIAGITHYVSRNAMNIDGFSEATIEKFVEKKFISNYSDIYFLGKFKDEIINMNGFGEKSYNNLINSIEESKNVDLANFIYALGIDQVGLRNANLLAKYFFYDFEKIKNATFEELITIEGFGEIIANSIVKYFSDNENLRILDIVLPKINIEKTEIYEDNLILNGKSFVITGVFEKFKNRNELQDKIQELGGKVSSSVSSKTDYLINNDLQSSSSKNKKAKELNIPIINEQEFSNIIDNI